MIRRGISNVYLTAVVALLVAGALSFFDAVEERRIADGLEVVVAAGNSLDGQIEVYSESYFRSTMVYFPALVVIGGGLIGLLCRNRRFAWAGALFVISPVLVMAGALLSQWLAQAALAIGLYLALGLATAFIGVVARDKIYPVS